MIIEEEATISKFAVRLCLVAIGKATPTRLPKHKLNEENSNQHVKVDMKMTRMSQPCTRTVQATYAESRRNGLTQGKAGGLLTQCQIISPKNKYTQMASSKRNSLYVNIRNDTHVHTHLYQQLNKRVNEF